MKKLIAIAVVFALVAGVAFAVDLSGSVTETVTVLKGDSGEDSKVTSGGDVNQIRIEGSGEVADGKFGGYVRLNGSFHADGDNSWDPKQLAVAAWGNAWWKPIDQFKLLIGNNGGDGFYEKAGQTGWMFYQTVTDVGVSMGGGNVWGGGYGGAIYRDAFFGGDGGGDALRLEITPLDMLAINLNLPFFDAVRPGEDVGDVFKKLIAQVDLNFDFGNIALTYKGGYGASDNDPGDLFVYYGGSFGALSLGVGLGYHFPGEDAAGDSVAKPIGIGLDVRYAADAFGVKFRGLASMGGDDKTTAILAEVLPYFKLADNLSAFVAAGLAITAPDEGDAVTGWHFNPYLTVGEEWGPKFVAGFKIWSDGKGDEPVTNWAVPIALIVSF